MLFAVKKEYININIRKCISIKQPAILDQWKNTFSEKNEYLQVFLFKIFEKNLMNIFTSW